MDHRIYEVRMLRRNIMELSFYTGEVKEYDIKRLIAYDEKYTALQESTVIQEPVVSGDNKKLTIPVMVQGEQVDYVINCEELFDKGILVEQRKIENVKLEMAARLVAVREAAHMTQKELGKESGINQADISRIERGLGNPSIDTIVRLASAMKKKVKIEFVDYDNPKDESGYIGELSEYLPPYKRQGEYTHRDLIYIPMKYRAELMDGILVDLRKRDFYHKDVIAAVRVIITDYMREHSIAGRVLESGVGFRENEGADCRLYMIPDVAVICDRNRASEGASQIGGPDMVFDIVSGDDELSDTENRSVYYKRLGVQECWIMNIKKRILYVYLMEKDFQEPVIYEWDSVAPVHIFNDELNINLKGLWRFIESV